MYLKTTKFLLITLLTMSLLVPNAFAAGSGGIRIEIPDAEAFGKGSAFVGQADNPSAIYYNPAGLTQLKGKNYFSSGFAVLSPSASFTDFAGFESQMVRQNYLLRKYQKNWIPMYSAHAKTLFPYILIGSGFCT